MNMNELKECIKFIIKGRGGWITLRVFVASNLQRSTRLQTSPSLGLSISGVLVCYNRPL